MRHKQKERMPRQRGAALFLLLFPLLFRDYSLVALWPHYLLRDRALERHNTATQSGGTEQGLGLLAVSQFGVSV